MIIPAFDIVVLACSKQCIRCGWTYHINFMTRPQAYCLNCKREKERDWASKNYNLIKANKNKSHLKGKYGLTPEEVTQLKEKQNNKCILCEQEKPRLVVDHNHTTGKVRGLLCFGCNAVEGYIKNNPQFLINLPNYLKQT